MATCAVRVFVSSPLRSLQVELDVLKRVSHKHILALIGAGNREEKPHRFLVLEVRPYLSRVEPRRVLYRGS